MKWIEKGIYQPLTAEPTTESRTKDQQIPAPGRDESLVRCIYEYFKDNPHGFEHCTARLAAMMDPNINIDVITRPSVDGGRDAIGTYRIGPITDPIPLDFALEAKCYGHSLLSLRLRLAVLTRESTARGIMGLPTRSAP